MTSSSPKIPTLSEKQSMGPKYWNYREAFARNLGLVSPKEQDILRRSHVAIAGMGGVGGVHLVTLARLGVGEFTIADFDNFEIPNFNRQCGAFTSTIGRPKVEVMSEIIRDINPEVKIRVFTKPLLSKDVRSFLEKADLFIDGIDAFVINIRRELFSRARMNRIHALSAGPFGTSTGWIVFSPNEMSFEEYMQFDDQADSLDHFMSFVLGMAPAGLHMKMTDLAYLDVKRHRAPSLGLACQLASGVAAAETLKILLNRGKIWSAPWYQQFDPYQGIHRRRKLWLGNKHPFQRIKKYFALKRIRNLALVKS